MAARPALSSLLSLQASVCSRSALQSVRPRAGKIALSAALSQPRPSLSRCLTCSARALNVNDNSTEGVNANHTNHNSPDDLERKPRSSETTSSSAAAEESSSDTPWYLQVEPPTHPQKHEPQPLPPLPAESPELLEPLMKYVYEEMGLDELDLLDLRDFDPPPALGQNLLMLFGTARSERHLHVASGRLVRWLRYNYKLEADADGLIGAGELRTKLRRMRRKAKLLGTSSLPRPGGDDGISTGWICVNLGTLGGDKTEAARFDGSGQLSGFGNAAPVTGCTIIVQVMTEARRAELNLEKLWRNSLARNQRQRETLSSAPPRPDKPSRGDVRPGTGVPRKTEKPHPFFEQRRGHSTTTMSRKAEAGIGAEFEAQVPRDLEVEFDDADAEIPELPLDEILRNAVKKAPRAWNPPMRKGALNEVRQMILAFQRSPPKAPPRSNAPFTTPEYLNNHGEVDVESQFRARVDGGLFEEIFSASSSKVHAEEQISLAEDVLRILHERGVPLLEKDVLVALITAITRCQSPSPRLPEARENLETLLRECGECPDTLQLIRLMDAYADKRLWDRFWDVWRMPPRFQKPRPPALYAALFRALEASRDLEQCLRGVRECVGSMALEDPVVYPDDVVYRALLGCIKYLDPQAERDADRVMAGERVLETRVFGYRMVSERTVKQRVESEFVKAVVGLKEARNLMAQRRIFQKEGGSV